jgi:hypothetical protein
MKKIILFLAFILSLASCKDEAVKEPDNLIEKELMVDVMYDLSLLDAIKYQNPNSLEIHKINPTDYIFKKYKIDSTQFAQNNLYYASNYKEYKKIYDQIDSRLKKNLASVETLVKVENKKTLLLKKKKQKLQAKKIADSIKKAKLKLKLPKEVDSIKRIKLKLKIQKKADSIKKLKQRKLGL